MSWWNWCFYGYVMEVNLFWYPYIPLLFVHKQLLARYHFFCCLLFVFRNRATNKAVKIYGISDDIHNRHTYIYRPKDMCSAVSVYCTLVSNPWNWMHWIHCIQSVVYRKETLHEECIVFIIHCRLSSVIKVSQYSMCPMLGVYRYNYFTKLIKNYHKSFR